MNNTFIKVLCPGKDGTCNAELGGVALSHHSLTSVECKECRSIWRVFHNTNSEICEFTRIAKIADDDRVAIPLVHCSFKE